MLQPVDGLELAADVELFGGVEEEVDSRVGVIVAPKHLLGLDGSKDEFVSIS